MTFSGVNCSLNAFSANSRRLCTNWRMRATASSFWMWKGSTASGTAPLGTCSLTPNTCRHQWQRAVISLCGVDRHLGAAAGALEAAQLGCVGRDVARARRDDRALAARSMPSPNPNCSSTRSPCHSLRQYAQISRSVPGLCRMSVAPHFGQRLTPSLSSLGGGVDGDRVGRHQFVADRLRQRGRIDAEMLPGARRHVLRRPGPVYPRTGGGVSGRDMRSPAPRGPAPWPSAAS